MPGNGTTGTRIGLRVGCARNLAALATLVVAVLGPTPAPAHHSAAQYDATHCDAIKGSVRRFELANPHSRLWLWVEDSHGRRVAQQFEGVSARQLRDYDVRWARRWLRVGEPVTVEFNPYRDGHPGGLLQDVTLADGTLILGWRPALCPLALAYASLHPPSAQR